MSLIFSRFFVFAILFAAQAALMIIVYLQFVEALPALLYAQWIFAFVMIIYLFNSSMDSFAKLTWMLIISFLPPAGAALLLWTQANIGHRKTTKLAIEQIDQTKGILEQSPDVFKQVEHDGSGIDDLSKYLSRSGCFPFYGRTKTSYFELGEYKFEAMLQQLEKAEKFIFMEYFILQEGYMWGRLLDVLIRKAKEVSFSQLRKQWRDSFQYLETPGQVIVLTQREKRRFLLSSLETELARTAYAVDDRTIANRCSLLEKMESQYL